MMKLWLGLSVVIILATIYLWPTEKSIEEGRQKTLLTEQTEAKRKVDENKRKALLYRQALAKQTEVIKGASNEKLRSIFRECERKISERIDAENKPAFAVSFPDYDTRDLEEFATMASAMKLSMGRPSAVMARADFDAKRVEWLKRFPSSVAVVAESATDTFSGPKQWARAYECNLDGLIIVSVRNKGQRYFFQ